MSSWIYGGTYGSAFGQGTTLHCAIQGSIQNATEANAQARIRAAFTAKNLWARVTANNGTQTLTDRKNAGAGGQSISISGTGTVEDTTHTTSLTDGDLYCFRMVVAGSHNNSCTIQSISVLLDDGNVGQSIFLNASSSQVSGGNYYTASGAHNGGTSTIGFGELKIPFDTTLRRFRMFISSAYANAMEADTYINQIANTEALSYSAGGTGEQEDTSATDIITAGDTLACKIIHTGTAGVPIITQYHSAAKAHLLAITNSGATYSVAASTSSYLAPNGFTGGGQTTESNAQVKARIADTFSNLEANISGNSRSDATTIDFRVGAASPSNGPAISIAASATGITQDTTHIYMTAATDLINYRVLTGGGTGTITPTAIGVQQGLVASVETELIGSPFGASGQRQMTQLLAQ